MRTFGSFTQSHIDDNQRLWPETDKTTPRAHTCSVVTTEDGCTKCDTIYLKIFHRNSKDARPRRVKRVVFITEEKRIWLAFLLLCHPAQGCSRAPPDFIQMRSCCSSRAPGSIEAFSKNPFARESIFSLFGGGQKRSCQFMPAECRNSLARPSGKILQSRWAPKSPNA